jgi:hypothetical protein
MGKRTLLLLTGASLLSHGDTVGYWRFDEAGAAAGGEVTTAANLISPGTLDASAGGGIPLFSDDVPAAEIFDPVSGTTYTNGFSLDVTAGNSQLNTEYSEIFDSSFTVEFFIKYVGEPGSYESVLRRREAADLGWQVDFDHAANQGFGRIRSRWDTPAGGISDNVAEAGIDENVNFVLGPAGNASAPKVYIDTGAKDELGDDVGDQNTGNANDYIYDAASANPNETDVALQGDGLNDVPEWHHVAVAFDEETGEIKFYVDYLLAQTRILGDSEANGYTHPATGLVFGKLAGTEHGLLMDELRYSDAILSPGQFLRETIEGGANTIGHWRLEEEGATDGGDIIVAENSASPLLGASPANGTPKYSSDVPSPMIFDPVSNTTFPNLFSLNATDANSRLRIPDDPSLSTSFTFEMFIKLSGEPGGYQSFVRRRELNDLRWQVDFDHANMGSFGRIRSRFDTPAAAGPDNMNDVGVDENVNFVIGPVGGGSVPDNLRIWIDTDPGDGLTTSYDDPTDWALDGDASNDNDTWHHIAITFDEDTGEAGFYYDYELMQLRTLSDSAADGYTHPAAPIDFGKFAGADYGLLLDEIRYSGEILLPFQFLQMVDTPAVGLQITAIEVDPQTGAAVVTWSSIDGQSYAVESSIDLENWDELSDDEIADGPVSTFTDSTPPVGASRVFYRVRENP